MREQSLCKLSVGVVLVGRGLAPAVGAELAVSEPVHVLDELAREPLVVRHPSGTLFVAGYGSQVTDTDPEAPPQLWKSTDEGATWTRIDVETKEDGTAGDADVDLAMWPGGTLYFLVMGFDRTERDKTHIASGVCSTASPAGTRGLTGSGRRPG